MLLGMAGKGARLWLGTGATHANKELSVYSP